MKKILLMVLVLLIFVGGGYVGYNFISDYLDANIELAKKEVYESNKTTLEAYKKSNKNGGSLKYYYFNIGYVTGYPVITTKPYYHNGVEKTYVNEFSKFSNDTFRSYLNNNINAFVNRNDNHNYDIEIVKNSGLDESDVIVNLGASGSLNSNSKYYYKKATTINNIKEELKQPDYSNVKSVVINTLYGKDKYSVVDENRSNVTDPYTLYVNETDKLNKVTYKFNSESKNGYYRFGIYAKCNVYSVIILDTVNKEYHINYELIPESNSFYKGYEFNTTLNFEANNGSKFNFDLEKAKNGLKLDYDDKLSTSCIVRFNTLGGTTIASMEVKNGSTIDHLTTPTKNGYTFVGWYLDKDYREKFNPNTPIYNDITLYAKWEKSAIEGNTCTVTFVTNCNTPLGPVTVNKGEKLNVNTDISNSGYVPGGLYYDSTFTRKFSYEDTINSDITLYLKWVKITSSFNPSALTIEAYNVTCLSNNKIEVDVKFINNTGSTINALNDVLFTIKVDDVIRTNAYFSKLDLGPLYNGSSKIWTLVIYLSPEEYNWFNKQPSGFRYQYNLICSFDVR